MAHRISAGWPARRRLVPLACLACALLGGCGGPRLAKVTGKVTYGSKPVTGGKIMFYPESGRMALGEIGPDGTYTLTTFKPGDGALVGPHRVAIESTRVGPGNMETPKSFEEELKGVPPGGKILVAGKVEWLVPEKYSRPENSGLTAKVENRPNEINFDLPAGK
jgi:hypothetical protein